MTKKKIIEDYFDYSDCHQSTDYGGFLCNFIEDRKLFNRLVLEQFLKKNKIITDFNSQTIQSLSCFLTKDRMDYSVEPEVILTFRLMVLDAFLDEQGIK